MSSGLIPRIGNAYSAAVHISEPWKCIAPFGLPVEPDEYSQNAMSSGVVSAAWVIGAASSTSKRHDGALVAVPTTATAMPGHASIAGPSLPYSAALASTARARESRSMYV